MVVFVETTESFIVCSVDGLTTDDKKNFQLWLLVSIITIQTDAILLVNSWQSIPYLQWPICTIGSRDYCHAPLGVSSFSFAIQNVWEMTTVVDKIACRSCTACPPSIVLRLFIADTTSSATICRQYVKSLRTQQKHGKFSCHNCRTTARPTKNQLTQPIL